MLKLKKGQKITLRGGYVEMASAPEEDKPRQFKMVGYSGRMVRFYGMNLVIDLAGMSIPNSKLPALLNHDLSQVAGTHQVLENTGKILRTTGVLSKTTATGLEVASLADEDFPWQASVGTEITELRYIDKGKDAQVNGRKFKGPFIHIAKSVLREVSFTPVGRDMATSAVVLSQSFKGGKNMKLFAQKLNALIEARVSDDKSKEVIVGEMAEFAGLSSDQVEALLAGKQVTLAAEHVEGFAVALSADQDDLMKAAGLAQAPSPRVVPPAPAKVKSVSPSYRQTACDTSVADCTLGQLQAARPDLCQAIGEEYMRLALKHQEDVRVAVKGSKLPETVQASILEASAGKDLDAVKREIATASALEDTLAACKLTHSLSDEDVASLRADCQGLPLSSAQLVIGKFSKANQNVSKPVAPNGNPASEGGTKDGDEKLQGHIKAARAEFKAHRAKGELAGMEEGVYVETYLADQKVEASLEDLTRLCPEVFKTEAA